MRLAINTSIISKNIKYYIYNDLLHKAKHILPKVVYFINRNFTKLVVFGKLRFRKKGNSEKLREIQETSKIFSRIQINSEGFNRIQRNSEKFRKFTEIQMNSGKFSRIQRDSRKFGENRESSK